MTQKERIKEELSKLGINTEAELMQAAKKMRPLNVSLMVSKQKSKGNIA